MAKIITGTRITKVSLESRAQPKATPAATMQERRVTVAVGIGGDLAVENSPGAGHVRAFVQLISGIEEEVGGVGCEGNGKAGDDKCQLETSSDADRGNEGRVRGELAPRVTSRVGSALTVVELAQLLR